MIYRKFVIRMYLKMFLDLYAAQHRRGCIIKHAKLKEIITIYYLLILIVSYTNTYAIDIIII